MTVFRPFFIKLSLPYSIIRDESVAIQAVVFNYLNKSVQAEVVMENKNDEFEFSNAFSNEIDILPNDNPREKRIQVTVPANDGVSVVFPITPKKIGYIDIRITAASTIAGDAVSQKLLVKPEGQTQYRNKAVLIDFKDPKGSESFKSNVSIDFPYHYVKESEKIYISLIGDILGPTLTNIEDLLRMPYGCGEQNMINFVPNIVILEYLTRANRIKSNIREKAIKYIESGYQRELTYKRDDGSFSAFGNNDKAGSTWLTAFVVKSFLQAKPYVDIDQSVIDKAAEFLVSRQSSDGSFNELGEVHHKPLQGGSAGGSAALSAYVLIALMQDRSLRTKYSRAIDNGIRYLTEESYKNRNPYDLVIITYALHLSDENPQHKNNAFARMNTLAKRMPEYTYWTDDSEEINQTEKQSAHFFLPKSNDVEMTSYALLTLMIRGDVNSAFPVLKWLISKQNSNGGFASTQDTVLALQGLGTIAQRISTGTISLNIRFKFKTEDGKVETKEMSVDFRNALTLQQIELPSSARYVDVEAKGFGTAIVQVSWQYNLQVSSEQPAFFLNPQNDKTSTENYLQLSICT